MDQDSGTSFPDSWLSEPSWPLYPWLARDLLRFHPPEAGAILDGSHTKTGAEDDPHPVRRSKPQSKAMAFSGRSLASSIMRGINAGALDEVVRCRPRHLPEIAGPDSGGSCRRRRRATPECDDPQCSHHMVWMRAMGDSGSAGAVR